MKWLVARYPQPPGTLIVLGSILTDPENPESSINRKTGVEPISREDRYDNSPAVRQQVHSALSKNTSALLKAVPPNSPLFSAGVTVEGRSSKDVQTAIEALNIRAEVFIPDKPYMDAALAKPEVVAEVKRGLWAKSLYIIVGVATASGLTVKEDTTAETKVGLEADVAIAGSGATGKAEVSHGKKAAGGVELEVQGDCDFAYRVREFEYSKLFRKFRDQGDRTEGALLGAGRDDDKDDSSKSDEDVVPGFDSWEEEDVEASETFTMTVEETADNN
jgi:hypothetical protein